MSDAPVTALHPDDEAVDRFAEAMKAKLASARRKGRGGWDDPSVCSNEHLAELLIGHLSKGNPGNFEDIANFAMMLHQRGADPSLLAHAYEQPKKQAVSAALALGVDAINSQADRARVVPELDEHAPVPDDYRNQASGYRAGWNDCLACRHVAPEKPAPSHLVDVEREAAVSFGRLIEAKREAFETRYGIDLWSVIDWLRREGISTTKPKMPVAMPAWTEDMAQAGFSALEARGFRVGASDLGMDDLKAVFEATLAAAVPVAPHEREAFEAWHRSKFGTRWSTGQPTRDMHNGVYDEEYGPKEQQLAWEAWQARAILSAAHQYGFRLPEISAKPAAVVRAIMSRREKLFRVEILQPELLQIGTELYVGAALQAEPVLAQRDSTAAPSGGVIVGYAHKSDVARLLDESQPDGSYVRIGLDHWVCWREDQPYDHLMPLYANGPGTPESLLEVLKEASDFYRSEMTLCVNDDNEHTAAQWRERLERIDSVIAQMTMQGGA